MFKLLLYANDEPNLNLQHEITFNNEHKITFLSRSSGVTAQGIKVIYL